MIQFIGRISPPPELVPWNSGGEGTGLFKFINTMFQLASVVAGIYFIIQIILAGYMYISANGDSKKTEQAWTKIWQSILGMVIIASAFVIAGLIEYITKVKILNPVINGPQ